MLWPVKRRVVNTPAVQLTPHGRDQELSVEQSVKFTAPPFEEETAAVVLVLITPHERDQEFQRDEFSSATDFDGNRDCCSFHSTWAPSRTKPTEC